MKTIIIVGLIGIVAALSVAYAALSTTLTLNGGGTVQTGTWGITFASGTCTASGKATAGTIALSPTSGNKLQATISGVVLKLPGDSVTCTIPVNNPSDNIDAVLTSFTSTQTVSPTFSGVSVAVKYDGAAAASGGAVTGLSASQKNMDAGTTKNLVATFTFASSATEVPSQDITLSAGASLVYGQA